MSSTLEVPEARPKWSADDRPWVDIRLSGYPESSSEWTEILPALPSSSQYRVTEKSPRFGSKPDQAEEKSPSESAHKRSSEYEAWVKALKAWIASAPPAPVLSEKALSREHIY